LLLYGGYNELADILVNLTSLATEMGRLATAKEACLSKEGYFGQTMSLILINNRWILHELFYRRYNLILEKLFFKVTF
jgi:hypothetical protein